MKLFVATDVRVALYDGKIYAREKYATILRRYFESFGSIVLCTRFENTTEITKDTCEITEYIDSIVEIPSLAPVLLNKCNKKFMTAMQDCDLVIARCPSIVAYRAADCARKLKKPYLAETMGDPWDGYWNHGLVGKSIAPYMFLKMKRVAHHADYALYVTREFLQKRYPCPRPSVAASNVRISTPQPEVLQKRLGKIAEMSKNHIKMMTTADISTWHKGQQFMIAAIPKLKKLGIDVEYLLVGEGDDTYLRGVVKKYNVSENVKFIGKLPLAEVLEIIDTVDIYIQPSLQEGLPRAVIEAMSRGCPCIGARTAGIPELLDDSCIVERSSVDSIVKTVKMMLDKGLESYARQNFEASKEYSEDVLDARRMKYFERIRKDIGK